MTVDYIIAGQGICGTWLSYYLLKQGKTVIVIDDFNYPGASNAASGLINPVTGRRVVTTWMAEELLPFIWKEYSALSETFNTKIITQKNILVFPSAPDLHEAFSKRIKEENSYIQDAPLNLEELHKRFNFPFGVMQISPCYLVNTREIIRKWRNYLIGQKALLEETYKEDKLITGDECVYYKTICAKKIIYCNGIQTVYSKYWKNLPFVHNKGQALIANIPGLSKDYMYKFGHLTLIPWEKNQWWTGSSNELEFATSEPTEDFMQRTVTSLKAILKTGFEIKDQIAALRPATVERRPFVGVHPEYSHIAILNGMGSKGCSLAPWFAKEITAHLTQNISINSMADVQRYSKVLAR
jgi:glycine/D-amino acid oxidase-like deaminating enzyme